MEHFSCVLDLGKVLLISLANPSPPGLVLHIVDELLLALESNLLTIGLSTPSTESPQQGQGKNPNLLEKHLPLQSKGNRGWTQSPLTDIL